MKIQKLETHDRLSHLKKDQEVNVWKGAEDCLKVNPLSLAIQEKCPYVYMFAHPRTMDSGHKEMYWQPRMSKPEPQTNSYLFRAKSKSDEITVCWLIPPREMWNNYGPGMLHYHEDIWWSIQTFQHNRKVLEQVDPDDWKEERCKVILSQIIEEHKQSKKPKPEPSGDSSPLFYL